MVDISLAINPPPTPSARNADPTKHLFDADYSGNDRIVAAMAVSPSRNLAVPSNKRQAYPHNPPLSQSPLHKQVNVSKSPRRDPLVAIVSTVVQAVGVIAGLPVIAHLETSPTSIITTAFDPQQPVQTNPEPPVQTK